MTFSANRTLIITLFSLFSGLIFSQDKSPLEDAVKYVEALTQKDKASALAIANKYVSDLDTLKRNIFIDIPDFMTARDTSFVPLTLVPDGSSQSIGGGVLGAPLIDALGSVIADRFREELTLAFLNSFREKLKADSLLGDLFPNAKRVLLYDDPFNYNAWMSTFRSALDEDLRELPSNLPHLLNGIKEALKLSPEEEKILTTIIAVYPSLMELANNPEKSYHALCQTLRKLPELYADSLLKANVKIISKLLEELGNGSQTDWADQSLLENLKDFKIAKTFVGFTIEKHRKTFEKATLGNFSKGKNLYELTHKKENSADLKKYVVFIQGLGNQVVAIKKSIADLDRVKRNNNGKLSYVDYTPLIDKSLDVLQYLMDSTNLQLIDPKLISKKTELARIFSDGSKLVNYAKDVNTLIAEHDYSKIIVVTLDIVDDYITSDSLVDSKFLKEFLKYGNLAVNLCSATSSEELEAAIKGAILPAQSFRLKRNCYFSVSVNSYAGLFYAQEVLRNPDAKNKMGGIAGFTAPIGIGLNWGLGKKDTPTKYSKYPTKTVIKNGKIVDRTNYFSGWSISLFFPIVDVGAITAFRLTDDETPVNTIQWANIVAPGAYVTLGLGNTPLAFSLGAQYGPGLKEVKAADGVATPTINSSAWRFGASLMVDIPFFNLYSKPEKVKIKK